MTLPRLHPAPVQQTLDQTAAPSGYLSWVSITGGMAMIAWNKPPFSLSRWDGENCRNKPVLYVFNSFRFSVFTTKLMLYSQVTVEQALLLLSGQSKSLGQSRQVGNDHCTGIIVSFASLITGSESKVLGDHCTRIITFFQSSIIGSVYR